jgi:hypothetical protein
MLAKIRLTFGGMCDIIDRDSLRVAGFLLPGEFLRREHVDIFSVFYFLTNRLMRTIFDAEEFEEFGTNVADKGRKLQMIVRIWD